MISDDQLQQILSAIDAANSADPTSEDNAPAALLYGQRMSAVLEDLVPNASPHLKIAVRGQHIERWSRPRRDWPEGKAGYLRWREELKRFHADRVVAIMREAGCGTEDCERTATIVRKQGIKRDDEVQALEDAACLVFIRWGFAAFAEGKEPDKILDIVRKTGRKMSGAGRARAHALGLPDEIAEALEASV